jgi:hypothetical protein
MPRAKGHRPLKDEDGGKGRLSAPDGVVRCAASEGQDGDVLYRFLLFESKRRAGAFCRAGPLLPAVFQPTSFDRAPGKERIRRNSSHVLCVSREPGPDRAKCADRRKKRPLLAQTRFGPIQRTGASPSFLRRLATPACFEPILSVPLFEAEAAVRRRSSARRDPAVVRT